MTEIKLPPLPDIPAAICPWNHSEDVAKNLLQAYATAAIEADRQARGEPKGTVYWLNASPTVAWVGRPPDDGEHIYTAPQPQQISEGHKPTKLNIGVSATAEGAAICIMKPNADGTVTVIYSGTHPLGDSLGCAMLEAATQPTTENP